MLKPFRASLSSSEKGQNGDSNPDLCDTGEVLYQCGYQADWELVYGRELNVSSYGLLNESSTVSSSSEGRIAILLIVYLRSGHNP